MPMPMSPASCRVRFVPVNAPILECMIRFMSLPICCSTLFIVLGGPAACLAAEPARNAAAGLPEGVTQNLMLSPGPGNPRNSEGDFILLNDGRIMFIYTRFSGGTGDEAAASLCSRSSADGGRTWSERDEVVIERPQGVQNIMSVSLLRLADGKIALFYLVKKSKQDCRAVMRVSTDELKTWSEPILCMPEEGYFVVNNGQAVQLQSGRILLPAAKHDWASDKPGAHRGMALCFFSDDGGKTWHRSKSALEAPAKSKSGLQEPVIVELKGGKLMMLLRTDLGCQYQSFSEDGGDTWSDPAASDLISPLSPASIKRIPGSGRLLLVWNDHTGIDPALRSKRTPLTVAVSKDEGKTWVQRKMLYEDPKGWYCYTAIAFAGDRILLGHCAGQQTRESSGLATTVITSFDVSWLDR